MSEIAKFRAKTVNIGFASIAVSLDPGGLSGDNAVFCPSACRCLQKVCPMLKKTEIEQFRDLLLALRARLAGDVENLTVGALDGGGGGGDSKSPTHIAELGTEAFEQEFALSLVANDQNVLGEIDAALERIDEGTYGLCESCREEGKPPSKATIPKTRLKAIPHARNCVNCERKREELSL